jgi:hypothetical protein
MTQCKNIVVTKMYKIYLDDTEKYYENFNYFAYTGVYQKYMQMYQYMMCSATNCITDMDQMVVHTGHANNILEVFKDHGYRTHDLWKQGNINIIYADVDVLFTKPRPWFDILNHDQEIGYRTLGHNCGIRYYGANMDQSVWDTMFEHFEKWDHTRYDYEQDVYSKIMLTHNGTQSDFSSTNGSLNILNYPFQLNSYDDFLKIAHDADAVHLHGSNWDCDPQPESLEFMDKKINIMKTATHNLLHHGSI